MTARGPSMCSNEFVREVPQHYFDRFDQYQRDTEAVEMSYFDFLVRDNSRYATVTGLQRAMERAANTDVILPVSATLLPDSYDHVGKHKAMDPQTDVGPNARPGMLSRLASELRRGSSSAKFEVEGELLKKWEESRCGLHSVAWAVNSSYV